MVKLEGQPWYLTTGGCPSGNGERIGPFGERRRVPLPRLVTLARPTTTLHGKGNQDHHDSNDADHVRYSGKSTGNVARVRPDKPDSRAHDEQRDHRG